MKLLSMALLKHPSMSTVFWGHDYTRYLTIYVNNKEEKPTIKKIQTEHTRLIWGSTKNRPCLSRLFFLSVGVWTVGL